MPSYIRTNIFTPISATEFSWLPDTIIGIEDGKICSLMPFAQHTGSYEDHSDSIALPGFIDLHVHLSQYRIRGLYHPALLPWLNSSVFPEESRSKDPDYAQSLARDFFTALTKAGTTFAVIYTAPYFEAAEAAFKVAKEMGIMAKIGMTLMDMNTPENMLQSTAYALEKSCALHEKWQEKHLGYIFTPRFAPTCTKDLMQEIGKYAHQHKAWIQTHLSENPDEIQWVQELFGKPSYTAVYDDFGLLSPRTILGHAIHLSDAELKLLHDSGASIAHCPDSNFYLKSGEYPLQRIAAAGIDFALGSDVGAGTTLNMPYHAKMMNFRQSSYPVLPAQMLYRTTLGSAKILQLDDDMGSIEVGKLANLVLLKPPIGFEVGEHSLSQAMFMGEDFSITDVFLAGKVAKW